MKTRILLALGLLAPLSAQADITVDPIYADHMVLQQGKTVPVSGTCDGKGKVTLRFNGQTVQAKVKNGKWRAELQPMQANAEGQEMTITQGDDTLVISDVLVGEVWVASGQSNMLWRLNQTGDRNSLQEEGTATFRFYHSQPQVHTNAQAYNESLQQILRDKQMYKGGWNTNTPQTRANMSAVGYYFGRELQQQLGVPVAVVHASLGGSEMMAWMPPSVLKKKYKDCLTEKWLESKYMSAWVRGRARQNIGKDLNAPHPYKPAYLFETGIEPWVDFPVAGVIWYQGESDAEIEDRKQNYELLVDLINGWRAEFDNKELPFLMVELPRINDKSALRAYWPEFRHVQRSAAKRLPAVHTLTTIDLGSTNSDVHPPRKLEVGTRLAHLAAAQVYGKDVAYSGPVVDSVKTQGNSMVVTYKHATGLTTTNGQAPVGFELSANGDDFYAADAVINGESITLTCDKVKKPKFMRYAWFTYMEPNLVNGDKLPAVPYAPAFNPKKGKK